MSKIKNFKKNKIKIKMRVLVYKNTFILAYYIKLILTKIIFLSTFNMLKNLN